LAVFIYLQYKEIKTLHTAWKDFFQGTLLLLSLLILEKTPVAMEKLQHMLLQSPEKLTLEARSGSGDVTVVPDFKHITGQLLLSFRI
jgi:hypothetical protein